MRNRLLKLFLIVPFFCPDSFATPGTNITSFQNTPLAVSQDNETINITGDGSIEVNNSIDAALNNLAASEAGAFFNTTISINTTLSSSGIISTGNSSPAISFVGDGASLSALTITSGTVSSDNFNSDEGTLYLSGIGDTSLTITVGQNSGNSGTLTNTAGGNAIYYSQSSLVDLTINNRATGTISSSGTAIKLEDSNNLSTLTLNNAGSISGGDYALYLDGYSADITNSGTIAGNIAVVSDSTLSITNNAGEISGDIDLGSNTNSIINLNGGTISGNVTMRDDNQLFIFNGGNLDGSSIDGYSSGGTSAGTVRIDADTTLHGFIGKNNPVSLLQISDGVSFNFNGNASRVGKISIGAATLNDFYGDIDTDEIDGSSAGVGIFNLTLPNASEITYTTPTGTTNGLEQFNITGNITGDPANAATLVLDQSINVGTTSISGAGSVLRLNSSNTISGDVEIGDASIFQLDDGSAVTGTIKGSSQYSGTLEIYNSRSDGAVSSVTLGSDVGGGTRDLFLLKGDFNTIIDAATNNVAINAANVLLVSGANLILGTGAVTGDIKGYVDSGSSNGFGTVTFNNDNTLAGNVGSRNGNALNTVELNTLVTVDTGIHEINAKNINIGSGATLINSGLISGGDNDDAGATISDAAILMGGGSYLTLNSGTSIYAAINSTDAETLLTINTTLDSSNSHLNIGNTSQLALITLLDNATLDVTGNNGTVKADSILLGNTTTLKLGNSEIPGSIDGSAGDNGTVDIQGNATLGGAIGSQFSIHNLNIGTADSGGYSVIAAESISATTVTINGGSTLLSLANDKTINSDVIIGNGAELSVGDGSAVNGTIKGAAQYQGILTIRDGTTFAAGGNIGAAELDLADIKIHGSLDLSGLSAYEAHSQLFGLTNGASLIIGSGTITGDIKGFADDGGATNGVGKGSVVFANDNSFLGTLGSIDGYALNEVSINSAVSVSTGITNINSSRITLYNNSNLTSSAEIISGGNNESATGLLGTAITLNDGTSLTLNNVDLFLGTINGNAAGQGNLTLSGNYGDQLDVDEHQDTIDIGGIQKLSSITLAEFANLDVHLSNGSVRADSIILNDSSTLTLGTGGLSGVIDGSADNKGTVNAVSSTSFDSGVTFGSTHGLAAINFGNNAGANIDVAHSIKAATVKIIGSATSLNLGAGSSINGNVVLDGDSILTLGDGSTVNGTITSLSDSSPTGLLVIREGASVATNGNIGGGGFNFGEVHLRDSSNLDLSANNNSINSSLTFIGDNSTLIVGSATVSSDIQAQNFSGGTNYGLGRVVFADHNTLGGYVGSDTGATLEKVTINSAKKVDGATHRIAALDIVLEDGASLTNTGSISSGSATEGGALENARITIGDNATLSLGQIDGEALMATIDGSANNKGALQISSGEVVAYGNIGNTHNLQEVDIESSAILNLISTTGEVTNNAVLKATNVILDNNATLKIGTNSVTGNIVGVSNGLGNVEFNGATNSLAGNVGGHNDNALNNFTINGSNSVAAGSHEINASTITLGTYATLTTSGAISGGADITGTTPIATSITLNTNALLILNNGSSIFGTIDGSEDGAGTIELTSNYTTNGNIGSTFKLASVILDDEVSLDLGTNSNSLNANTVYLGTDANLILGDAGTVHASIQSLSADSGVVFLNDSITLDSGNTFGGDTGLLSLHIDNAANGNVIVDSQDSIKARNVTIDGFRSTLNLAADKTLTGNVTLGDGSRLNLAGGSAVTGTIDSVTDSGGALRITSGTVVSQSNIGNAHILGSVTLNSDTTLNLATNDNILKSTSITLNSGSNLIVGSGLVGSVVGAEDGDGDVTLSRNITIDEGTTLGSPAVFSGEDLVALPIRLNQITVSGGVTATVNENMLALDFQINGHLTMGANKEIIGDNLTLSGTITMNDHSFIRPNLNGVSGTGTLIINDNADFTSTGYLGGSDDNNLSLVVLRSGADMHLETNNNDVNATSILLFTDSTLHVGSGALNGDISGISSGKGTVHFYNDKNLSGALGSTSSHSIESIIIDDGLTITTASEIAASSINIGNATLISTGQISGGSSGGSLLQSAITLGNSSTLQLNDNGAVAANINGAAASNGTIDIFGNIAGNIDIGNSFKVNGLNIDTDSSLDVSANNNSVNVTSIALASSATLQIGTNTFASAIDGGRDDYGILTIATSKTATMNGNIGAAQSLHQVNINANATLDLATHNNSLSASTTVLGNNAVLNVGSGDITGSFVGASSGDGTINFGIDKTVSESASLGNSDISLGTITIANNVDLSINSSIYANHINVGTIGTSASSLNMNLSGINVISGDIEIANLGTLAINSSGFLTTGAIYGKTNNVGTLNLSGGGTLTLNGDIGSSGHALSVFSLGENYFVNAYTNNASIIANDIYLSSNSGIVISSGALSGNVHGGGNGDFIAFLEASGHTLSGDLGVATDDFGINDIYLQSTLNTGSHDIRTNQFIFDSPDTVLNLGSGNIDITNFTNNNSGSGTINFTANNNINFAIDADNTIAELNIANGAIVTQNQTINATTTTIGTGTSGKLILAADQTLNSNVQINNGGNLTLNNSSVIFGNINSASGSSITFNGDSSTASNINISGRAIFNHNTTTIITNSFNTNSGSTLSLPIDLSSPSSTAIDIIGSAIIAENTKLNLTISGSAVSGSTFTLISASNPSEIAAISNSNININSSNRNIINGQVYSTSILDNQLILTLTGDFIADAPPTINFIGRNSKGTYDAIMEASNASGGLSTIQNYLTNNSFTDAQKEVVVKSAAPQVDNSSNRVMFNNVSTIGNIISARLASLYNDTTIAVDQGSGFNFSNNDKSTWPAWTQNFEPLRDNNIKPAYPLSVAIDDNKNAPSDKSLWIQTFSTKANQSNSEGEGYKANSGGITVGLDCIKCYNFILGASAGYAASNIGSGGKRLDIDTYQLSVYSGHNAKSYFFNNTAGIAINKYASNRQIPIAASSAKANYGGESYNARSEVGANYKLKNQFILTPSLIITAAYNVINDYSETGAGTLNLHVNNNNSSFLEGRIGAELSRLYLTKKDTKIRPQISLSYGYDFIGDQQKTTNNFIGQTTSFSNSSAKIAQGSLKFATGFIFYAEGDVNLSANYGLEHRADYNSSSAWLKINYGF